MTAPDWLVVADPDLRALLRAAGVGLIVTGLVFWVCHRAWVRTDPNYRGRRRRPERPKAHHRDPTTGQHIVSPELEAAGRVYLARLELAETDPSGGGLHSWPAFPASTDHDRCRMIPVPAQRPPGAERPTRALITPTGSWVMPATGRHHHRAEGGPREHTRPLHPGYRADARARVVPADGTDPVLD